MMATTFQAAPEKARTSPVQTVQQTGFGHGQNPDAHGSDGSAPGKDGFGQITKWLAVRFVIAVRVAPPGTARAT